MGQRGPRKQPAAIKIAKGTFRPDRDAEVPMPPGMPACPEWLADVAKELWRAIGPTLAERGVLTLADQLSFALLCQAWADYRLAVETLAKEGLTCVGTNGSPYQHPLVGIRNRSWANVMKACQEFGLTASSRCGLGKATDNGGREETMTTEAKAILGL